VEPGTRVEVRSRFDRRWSRGFEVVEELPDGGSGEPQYRVRRRSDGSVLPTLFPATEVREDSRRSEMWWV